MAANKEAPAHARTLSFGKQHARTVSADELHQLGLSKPLDEFYKLLHSSNRCFTAHPSRKAREPAFATALRATIARPLPWFLTPEALAGGAALVWGALALVLHHTAALLVPLALWYLAAGGAGTLHLPRQLQALHPALAAAQLRATPDVRHRAGLVGALLFALWLAELTMNAKARAAWQRSSRAVDQAWLEAFYADMLPPGSSAQAAASDPSPAKEHAAAESAFVAQVTALLRETEGEREVRDFGEGVAQLRRLAAEVEVAVPAAAETDAAEASRTLQEVRRRLGLP